MTTLTVRPKPLDLNLYAGDAFAVRFNFTHAGSGTPWPLTGTWKAEIRVADEVVMEFAVDDTGAADGYLNISLDGIQTDMLGPLSTCQHPTSTHDDKCILWDLQQSDGPRTWYAGAIRVAADVTT
jgi:hypothetical protein